MANIILPTEPTIKIADIREGLKKCIAAAAPKARVHKTWAMRSSLTKTVTALKSSKDENRIHSWTIFLKNAKPVEKSAGGFEVHWILDIKIWGFLGYTIDDEDSPQDILEEEARKISNTILVNKNHLGMDNSQALFDVGNLSFSDIDVISFGTEHDVIVAPGNITIELSENAL